MSGTSSAASRAAQHATAQQQTDPRCAWQWAHSKPLLRTERCCSSAAVATLARHRTCSMRPMLVHRRQRQHLRSEGPHRAVLALVRQPSCGELLCHGWLATALLLSLDFMETSLSTARARSCNWLYYVGQFQRTHPTLCEVRFYRLHLLRTRQAPAVRTDEMGTEEVP